MKKQPTEQDLRLFNEQKTDLIELLKYDMQNREDLHEKMFINYLLNQKIENTDDLKRILFAYNEGNLISYEDLYLYDKQTKHKSLIRNYNAIRHIVNTMFTLVPMSIIIYETVQISKKNIVLFPLGIMFALIAAIFFSIAGNSFNIGLAHICGIPDSDERVQSERLKRKVGIASGIISTFSIGKNIKNGLKDIADVDSWKEMK